MNKKIINAIIILLVLALIPLFFLKYSILGIKAYEISKIFLLNVMPFLFVMMVINNLLVNLNLPYFLRKFTKNPYFYIMILSMLSGSPINASIIASFLDKKYLNEKEASLALCFTTFNNPLFLYNYFHLIFKDSKIIITLFVVIYLSNICLFLLLNSSLKNGSYQITYQKASFSKALINALKQSGTSLINIYITICFFYIFTNVLITNNDILSIILKGSVEITQGLNSLITLNASLKIKELLNLAILMFAGFSIHIQISQILSKYAINYKYFYLSRIFLILLSSLILLIISV